MLPAHPDALDLLLDDFHVCDISDLELDPMEDPYWDQFMLIPVQPLPVEEMTVDNDSFDSMQLLYL
jgi:hypothetical protein